RGAVLLHVSTDFRHRRGSDRDRYRVLNLHMPLLRLDSGRFHHYRRKHSYSDRWGQSAPPPSSLSTASASDPTISTPLGRSLGRTSSVPRIRHPVPPKATPGRTSRIRSPT